MKKVILLGISLLTFSLPISYMRAMEQSDSQEEKIYSLPSLKWIATKKFIEKAVQSDDYEATKVSIANLPEEVVEYFIDYITDYPSGRSLLHTCSTPKEMKHLLEGFWVDPLVKTAEGETPLMTFIRDGKREQAFAYLNYLKEAGIPYSQKDIYGKTALDLANSYGDRELVSALAATEYDDDNAEAKKANENPNTLHEQEGLFKSALSWFGQDKKDKPATIQEKVDDENVCIKNALEEYLSLSSLSEACNYLDTLPKGITKEALAKESAKGDKYTGLTCLHTVTNSEKVKFLLLLNANFNVLSKEGQNPLHYMIKTGSFDMAIMLLDRFDIMNFDIRDHRGMTPLGYAIIAKHDALIKKLLEKGSDLFKITTINDSEVFPLKLFLDPRFYNVELVSSLFSHSVLTKLNVKNKMKLLIVALENHYEEVKNILLGNDTFETLNLNGMNFAMYLAKSTRYHDVLEKFVLPQMKHFTASDSAGNSIMHYAVKKCNFSKKEKIIKAIFPFMPSLAHQNNKGETPLHVALMNKEFNIDLLLNHDVSAINVQDHKGYTPLHIALVRRDEANVLTLLSYGADINIQDVNGNTPLHIALQKCPHLVDLLLSYHPLIDIRNSLQGTPLHAALENSDSKNAKEFIERGADVNAVNSNGDTPVLIAVNSCPEVIYDLVKKNALLDKPNKQGLTPLHVLLKNKNTHLAKSFINAGVNVNAQDENGISPLMIAAENDLSEIFILLLQKGADHSLKDVHGHDCTSRLGGLWGNCDLRGEYEGYIYYHLKK